MAFLDQKLKEKIEGKRSKSPVSQKPRSPPPDKNSEKSFHAFMSTLKGRNLQKTPKPRELMIRGGSNQGLPVSHGKIDVPKTPQRKSIPASTKASGAKPPLAKKKYEPNFDYFMGKLKEKKAKAKERKEIITKFKNSIERFNIYS